MKSTAAWPLESWRLASVAPGTVPEVFRPVSNARTVAGAWREWGVLDLNDRSTAERIDGLDHWWQATIPAPAVAAAKAGSRIVARFEAIATVSALRLNGEILATSTSQFVPLDVDLTDKLTGDDVLEVVIGSLTDYLDATKWQRPRWKTRVVSDQRLRNVRTSLLGRISWAPPTPLAGPYGKAALHVLDGTELTQIELRTSVRAAAGHIDVSLFAGERVERIALAIGDHGIVCELARTPTPAGDSRAPTDGSRWSGEAVLDNVSLWSPWTHGEPTTMSAELITEADGQQQRVSLSPVGFRHLDVDTSSGGFAIRVNGVPVFARGALAFPLDIVAAAPSPESIEQHLMLARQSGCNIVRLGGTGWYESDHFHELCDRFGLMVWQDLPFANLDYPSTDEFRESVNAELCYQVTRLAKHPSTVVICGSSEGEQQAAMMGVKPEVLAETPGRTWIAATVASVAPGVEYVASSPTGGHLPMRVDSGVAHYFGVGAYLRPLSDAITSGVRFASECLAFANVPTREVIERLGGMYSSLWKERVPQDSGVDWDFDDVRDYYVDVLFGSHARSLRTTHPQRWQALSQLASGELMSQCFARWRSSDTCAGGIVLALNDMWDAPGWGLIDSSGLAKPALRRVSHTLQPVAVLASDNGLNGLDLWVVNDSNQSLDGTLRVQAIRNRSQITLDGALELTVPPHSKVRVPSETVWGRFADPTYAYRFGERPFDAVFATCTSAAESSTLGSVLFQLDGASGFDDPMPVSAQVVSRQTSSFESTVSVLVSAHALARFIEVCIDGFVADEGQFDLGPGHDRLVALRSQPGTATGSVGTVRVMNSSDVLEFAIDEAQS